MLFQNRSFSFKIGAGFFLVLLLLTAIALISVFGLNRVVDNAREVIGGNEIAGEITQRTVDHLEWSAQVSAFINNPDVTELSVQKDPHKCGFGKWYYGDGRKEAETLVPQIADPLAHIEQFHTDLHESAQKIDRVYTEGDVALSTFLAAKKVDHLIWMRNLRAGILSGDTGGLAKLEKDPHRCSLGRWLNSDARSALSRTDPAFRRYFDRIERPHEQLHAGAQRAQDLVSRGAGGRARQFINDSIEPAAEGVLAILDSIIAVNEANLSGLHRAQNIYNTETSPLLDSVKTQLNAIVATTRNNIMTDTEMLSALMQTRLMVIVLSLISIAVGFLSGFFIARGVTSSLRKVIDNLKAGSEEVNAAGDSLSQASQSIAQGASEQASNLEEVSSSLEQMSEKSKEGAQQSSEARQLTEGLARLSAEGTEHMQDLNASMTQVKEASDETAKIIKDINDIASNTNLLALNAAVEAARAGEAGKGFAVVAEEVRELSRRTSEAAKNTADLIKNSQDHTAKGVQLSGSTAEVISRVQQETQSILTLIENLSAGNREQSDGISEVNGAVSQLDEVTQSSAANSEEMASSSEELSSQAQNLAYQVQQLVQLVEGSTDEPAAGPAEAAPRLTHRRT
ncbi:MAG: methyl-accepting chemotaxis protein [Fibrobacterota bacterium]